VVLWIFKELPVLVLWKKLKIKEPLGPVVSKTLKNRPFSWQN
jgi:hypothetical protein